MNHPSEWTRYYDAPQGTYRYKHKGTGVVRDTLMAIGRRFTKKATKEKARQALKRAVKSPPALKKVVEEAWKKPRKKGLTRYKPFCEEGKRPRLVPSRVKN